MPSLLHARQTGCLNQTARALTPYPFRVYVLMYHNIIVTTTRLACPLFPPLFFYYTARSINLFRGAHILVAGDNSRARAFLFLVRTLMKTGRKILLFVRPCSRNGNIFRFFIIIFLFFASLSPIRAVYEQPGGGSRLPVRVFPSGSCRGCIIRRLSCALSGGSRPTRRKHMTIIII